MLNSKNSTLKSAALILSGLLAYARPGLSNHQANAFLQQASCRNFVRLEAGLVLLGGDQGVTTIESNGTAKTLGLGQNARDALIYDREVVALVEGSILSIDRQTGATIGRYNTQTIKAASSLLPQEMPRAIGRIGQTLLVAHGTLGVALFDLTTRQVEAIIDINQGQKLKGMAQDVMIYKDDVYVLVDNYQMNPLKPSQEFRGILRLDLPSRSVADRFAGLDPGATTAALFDDTILVSFSGMPIWKLHLPLSSDTPLASVAHPVADFGRDGHPVGHLAFDGQLIWTCHRQGDDKSNVPVIYQRSALGL